MDLAPCDTCGVPTTVRAGKRNRQTPRCGACRIATQSCSITHRADREALLEIRKEIATLEQKVAALLPSSHYIDLRARLEAEERIRDLLIREEKMKARVLDLDRISEDPAFIARYLGISEDE